MKVDTITKVVLGHEDIQKACALYIENNGVTGASDQYQGIAFRVENDQLVAMAMLSSQTSSSTASQKMSLDASNTDTTTSQYESLAEQSSNTPETHSTVTDDTQTTSKDSSEKEKTLESSGTTQNSSNVDLPPFQTSGTSTDSEQSSPEVSSEVTKTSPLFSS